MVMNNTSSYQGICGSKNRVICIAGDGSIIDDNLQELEMQNTLKQI